MVYNIHDAQTEEWECTSLVRLRLEDGCRVKREEHTLSMECNNGEVEDVSCSSNFTEVSNH